MLKKAGFAIALAALFLTLASMKLLWRGPVASAPPPADWNKDTPVAVVLAHFGDEVPASRAASQNADDIRRGKELFTTGTTTAPDGSKAPRQSRYFLCTACHNNRREDPDLRVSDPQARLEYALQNGLPFLQGTTMYGTMNKVSWYNGDYVKKYGDLVKPANESIEAAIHLCATVCSQGRDFEDWEMKAMLAYYWSLELKLGDLDLSESDYQKLRTEGAKNVANPAMVKWLKSYYLQGSLATFGENPEDMKKGYPVASRNVENGRKIYMKSCMSCHSPNGASTYLQLDESKVSRKFLASKLGGYRHMNLYNLVRHGTGSYAGHEAYMPLYPQERMSDQQVEDLRAYIESE